MSRRTVNEPKSFGKVAVLMGGDSSERTVSLASGNAVLSALRSRDVDAQGFDPSNEPIEQLRARGFDRAWIALHGPGGEDGALQGALEWLGVPYTGSGVLASALAMDKLRSKKVFAAAGIPTPEFAVVRSAADARQAALELGFPLVLKPVSEGSSIGMSKVFDESDLSAAVDLVFQYGSVALAERCVVGAEVTVAVLNDEPLPSIRVETPRVFYDYRAKYEADSTRYICPASDDPALEQRYAELAMEVFQETGCAGWGRVDLMHGEGEEPVVLEVNTVPGMTDHSLVPMAAKARGIDYAELCWRVLETSMVPSSGLTMEVAANGS